MRSLFAWCLLLLLSPLAAKENEVDALLEPVLSKTAIVSSRQIKIPGYPNAYNPSLIPYKGGYLLSFRFISRYPEKFKNAARTDVSFVGVARLDKNFKVSEKSVQLLPIVSHSPTFSLSAEDARLFLIKDRIFLFFNDLRMNSAPGFAMYFGELVEERGQFALKGSAKLLDYLHAIPIEKNWSPFLAGDRLYVIYADRPRIILEVDVDTGRCQEVTRTLVERNWSWGEIRGGTPACLVDGAFLTFFHSSFPAHTSKGRAYVMGAYTFDPEYPFAIRAMSPRPLGDLRDYTESNDPKVIFPGGLVVQDKWIHVAWGRADKQIHITTFDKEKLLSSMQ